MLVAEMAHSDQAQKRATVTLAEITLLKGESWMAAARRLVLHVRAANRGRDEAAHVGRSLFLEERPWDASGGAMRASSQPLLI